MIKYAINSWIIEGRNLERPEPMDIPNACSEVMLPEAGQLWVAAPILKHSLLFIVVESDVAYAVYSQHMFSVCLEKAMVDDDSTINCIMEQRKPHSLYLEVPDDPDQELSPEIVLQAVAAVYQPSKMTTIDYGTWILK